MQVAQRVDYPFPVLALGLEVHRAPGRLRAEGVVSKVTGPSRSLIAGCNQSVDLSKLALWQVLESMHAEFRPLELPTWVDDIGRAGIGRGLM